MFALQLAAAIDISAEDLAAYERGQLRITSAALVMLAEVLRAPISYFFEGFGDNGDDHGRKPSALSAAPSGPDVAFNTAAEIGIAEEIRETAELARAVLRISRSSYRKEAIRLAASVECLLKIFGERS